MTDARELLLRRVLARRGHALGDGPAIPRRPAGTDAPLTPAQRRLWTLDRLGGGGAGSAYLLPAVFRLTGPVDADALAGALTAVVRRHEALRTALVARDGAAVQVVAPVGSPGARPVLARHDLAGRPAAGRDAELARVVAAETVRPFALDTPPLVRAALVRLAEDEHVLAVVAHHAVCDDLSLGIVLRDLLAAYGGAALVEPPVRFADYAHWSVGRGSARTAELAAYWAGQLDGAPALLDLPTDRPRPPAPSGVGDSVSCRLPAALSPAVAALARDTGGTPFMVLLAALGVLLGRYSGQDEVVIGSPVTDRAVPELEDVVGMFVDTVALRVDLRGDPSVRELLARVRRTCVAGFDSAGFPFERVVELVNPPRQAGRHPLFQVMVVLNPAGTGPPAAAGVPAGTGPAPGAAPARGGGPPAGGRPGPAVPRLEPLGLGATPARFELTLLALDGPDGLSAQLDYSTDLFEPATADRLGRHFGALLAALTEDPDRRIGDLPLPAPAGLAGDAPPVATAPPVHELIVARAAATPDAAALVDDAGTTTYGALVERSGRLAAVLAGLGVGPETVVGLAATGPAAIVGLLGVLRAGAAYQPIDPAAPPDRVAALLADTGAPVLLVHAPDRDRVPAYPGHVLCLDEAWPAAAAPAGTVHSGQAAYVVHTSGSTGTPKGVVVPHGALTNLALAFRDRHGFGPGHRLLMLPPLSFDASAGDIFPALVSGAALVLHADPGSLSGPELARVCREHRVTAVDTASALWQRWVRDLAGAPADLGPLAITMVGGESVPVAAVAEWARIGGGTFYNHYGPTEATVCATTYLATGADGGATLPMGRPLPGVRTHVLDGRMRPVPVGVPGELYLGGVGVARGYAGRPDLTAAAFVPDPWGDGERLYRTGDRVRHRADGELEFLGRADRQVKLRGHRIELGEVEAVLAAHPGVREVAVVALADASGSASRLVGYVVPAGEPPSPAELRVHCGRMLPGYAVPAGWVSLAALPLTRHGKLDLRALPAPSENGQPGAEPATPTERALAAVWADLLGVERVGADDDFFDLGGHSLLVPALGARVLAGLGVALPARALFETPRLADLAGTVDDLRAGRAAGPPPGPSDAELRAAAVLPDDVCRELTGRPATVAGRVLLTGGTGFLGSRLLADRLEHTGDEVHCLVRAPSAADGAARLRAALERTGRWRPEWAGRIVALPGELSRPLLGWPRERFDALADRLDAIVHVAGAVRFAVPYRALVPDNVEGTVELLRLAGTGRTSALHFVSTLGVFLGDAHRGRLTTEADVPDDPAGLESGYGQSKWVADALVRAAGERGLPVTIHRPARIGGDSGTGAWTPDDVLVRLLTTFVQVGCAYVSRREHDIAPVDHVAAAIGRLSRRPGPAGGAYHYRNARTLSGADLVRGVREYGYPLEVLDNDTYLDRVRAALGAGRDLALAPLAGLRTHLPTGEDAPRFDCTATERAAGIDYPAADGALLRRYLDELVRSGALPAPPTQGDPR